MKRGDEPRRLPRSRIFRPPSHALALLTIACALLGAGVPARAARPIVLIAPFRGPGAAQVEQLIQRTLKLQSVVLSPGRYATVAKSLFAESGSPEDVAAVAKEFNAQWVVTGTTKAERGRWSLNVSLRDGRNGQSRAKLRYPLRGPRVPPNVLKLLQRELVDAFIDAISSPGAQPSPPDEPRSNQPVTRAPPDPEPRTNPSPNLNPDPSPNPNPNPNLNLNLNLNPSPTPNPPPAPSGPAPGSRPRWARYFELAVGGTLTGRRFAVDPPPPRFSSVVVAGLRADLTIFPLAFTWKNAYGLFSGLGVGVTFDKPFWPNSTAKADLMQSFPTSEMRVEGGLRWKITLYKPMPRPQLHLIAEGGLHDFSFAKGAGGEDVVGVPDVRYVYASLGGGLTVHFAEWAWIWAKFVYHAVTDAGPIQVREQYGLAASGGLRFTGGIDFLVWKGLRLGALGMYERFDLRFGYDPERVKVADGATDEYYGAMLMLGYVF